MVLPITTVCIPTYIRTYVNYETVRMERLWFNHLPCTTMYSPVLPCIPLSYHVFPCPTMYSPVLPCIPLSYHVFPCPTMYSPVLPCILPLSSLHLFFQHYSFYSVHLCYNSSLLVHTYSTYVRYILVHCLWCCGFDVMFACHFQPIEKFRGFY